MLALLLPPGPALAETFTARVVNVHDGDTVTVLIGQERRRIRLSDIDAPERPGQPFSDASRRSLAEMVASRTVVVEVRTVDAYGRPVARLRAGQLDVNLEQVRRGYAWSFDRYNRDPRIKVEALAARLGRRGLWADPNPTPPWQWRRRER